MCLLALCSPHVKHAFLPPKLKICPLLLLLGARNLNAACVYSCNQTQRRLCLFPCCPLRAAFIPLMCCQQPLSEFPPHSSEYYGISPNILCNDFYNPAMDLEPRCDFKTMHNKCSLSGFSKTYFLFQFIYGTRPKLNSSFKCLDL